MIHDKEAIILRKKNDLIKQNTQQQSEQLDFFQIVDQFFRSEPLQQFMNEFDTMITDSFPHHHINVNTFETDKTCVINLKIPPVKKEQIKLELFDQYLTISITNREEIKEFNENSSTFRNFTSLDSISRTILLPYSVKEHDIKTKFKKGLLTVTIPKKAKKILIDED
ncbi:Hsp20/alpha crystallin family protein [Metabacillus sediminilitoris]|uniref:Hsp20/alpha crystallin family protein n=1 Tax=Metabacillus sediminilitoris TaxID=2567941 RepID=A0A4S4C4V9_9BACI|nr:Hsp20 family protein [Metabacillus sediminilitoris]THF82796.1 Hsp20/alpha crystallin family protein [Metabacillus sediminilitoris]